MRRVGQTFPCRKHTKSRVHLVCALTLRLAEQVGRWPQALTFVLSSSHTLIFYQFNQSLGRDRICLFLLNIFLDGDSFDRSSFHSRTKPILSHVGWVRSEQQSQNKNKVHTCQIDETWWWYLTGTTSYCAQQIANHNKIIKAHTCQISYRYLMHRPSTTACSHNHKCETAGANF